MTVTDNKSVSKAGKLDFRHLPGYASFILEHKLDDYVKMQLQVSREENVPLLRFFNHLNDDELIKMSTHTVSNFLTVLKNNSAEEFIKNSTESYIKNTLPEISRDSVLAEDITVLSLVRKKVLRTFLQFYTTDFTQVCDIMEEVDRFIMASETSSFNAYMQIQKEKISGINHELEERYSELLLIRDQLEQSEQLNKQSQALTHIGNWTWDIKEGDISWSDEMYRIYGLEPQSEKITFDRFLSFIHPVDRDKRVSEIEESLKTYVAKDYVIRIIGQDGKEKTLRGKGEVILNNENIPVKLVGTCQDVTVEYKLNKDLADKAKQFEKVNASLELKNEELKQINKELESFNYVASHDLQEPLRKIQTFISRIQEKAKPELVSSGTLDYLNKIVTSTQRMQLLIEDLLTFSHTTSMQTGFSPTDLNAVVEDVKTILATTIEEKSAIIEYAVLPTVYGIPFQLQQLMLNLISNALKYSKSDEIPRIQIFTKLLKGKSITDFSAVASKQYIELKVIDNGIGFDKEHKEKIFGLFQRLHNKDKYSGTGIGLAICKKIVNNHKGFINAEGESNQGAVFTVYLPVEREKRSVKDVSIN